MSDIEGQEILPADDGAKPWLHEKKGLPVFWDGDYTKRVGTARVYEKDGALLADVTLDGPTFDESDHELFRSMAKAGNIRFGINGQTMEYETVDGVQKVTRVEPLALLVSRAG